MQVTDVLRELFTLFEKCDIEYMVGGSFASGAWGEPRHTNDIDIVAKMDKESATCVEANALPSFQLGIDEVEICPPNACPRRILPNAA